MREFRGFEYVDGDIRVYVRLEGEDDSAWQELGVIKFDEPRQIEGVAKRLGLEDMQGIELARLSDELAMPRRW